MAVSDNFVSWRSGRDEFEDLLDGFLAIFPDDTSLHLKLVFLGDSKKKKFIIVLHSDVDSFRIFTVFVCGLKIVNDSLFMKN